MATIREQLLKQIVQALNSADRPEEVPQAQRASVIANNVADFPVIQLLPVRETVEDVSSKHSPLIKRVLSFTLRCRVRLSLDDEMSVDEALEPLIDWCTASLAKAYAMDRLGGLATYLTEVSTEWTVDMAEDALADADINFEVSYSTARTSQNSST